MKSYYGGPIGTHQRSFELYHPRSLRPPRPEIGDSQPQPRTAIAIISGTDCKFGRYIQRVHTNKSPLKIWEKMERERIQGMSNFLSTPYLRNG